MRFQSISKIMYSPCSDDHFLIIIVHVLHVITRGHEYASWMRPVAMNARRGQRKPALQGSGLVRTVGLCAQRIVAQAIARTKDTL